MAKPNSPIRPAPAILLRMIGAHVLEWAKSHAVERGVQAQSLDLADGPAADTILAAASDISADAIVMGTRGLRPIEAITVGSAPRKSAGRLTAPALWCAESEFPGSRLGWRYRLFARKVGQQTEEFAVKNAAQDSNRLRH